jgi:hypothetical protein
MALKIKPTMTMPTATTLTNTTISLGFRTLRRMTVSGKEMPMTDP